MVKSFREISWDISEQEYRDDPALSYSMLSTFSRDGFNGLPSLFDKKESESLMFGSCVDAIITGGMDEFNDRFVIAKVPDGIPSILKVVKRVFELYGDSVNLLSKIPDDKLLEVINECKYQGNWRDVNRIKSIRESGSDYYKELIKSVGKIIVPEEMYNDVINCVDALNNSLQTKWYFNPDPPPPYNMYYLDIERLYQLKFKTSFDDIDYRCMADLLIVDHTNKIVYPVDLKTSSHHEWDFFKSFIDWNYQIQARLYWRIIRKLMDEDPYFKDFTLENYRFIVVNKKSLTPLIWIYPDTQEYGTLCYHNNEIKLKDPFDLGKELRSYLDNAVPVPHGIDVLDPNNIVKWLNKDD